MRAARQPTILPCDCCGHFNLNPSIMQTGCPVCLGMGDPLVQLPARLRPANHWSVVARFNQLWEEVPCLTLPTPCRMWTGAKSRGGNRNSDKAWYTTFNPGGDCQHAVRGHVYAAYIGGLIPDLRVPYGMNLDHLCVNSLCVNFAHLELVEKLVNQQRKRRR